MLVNEELTVGVSAYGNHQTTKHCLNAIFDALEGNFELILVDDCSPDNGEIFKLFLEAADRHKNTKIYRFTQNLEYSGSLNCILSHASGCKVLFVSNDIFISDSYIRSLLGMSEAHKDFGVIRGVSNYVDNGKATHNINVSDKLKHFNDIPAFSKIIYEQGPLDFFEEDYLTGDAFLVNEGVLSKIGSLDPLFYGYFADHDFGIRVRKAGYKLAVARNAFAYHYQNANFDYLPEHERRRKLDARWAKVHENWARFKLKHQLPIHMLYPDSLNGLDWGSLNSAHANENLYVPPADYSRFLVDLVSHSK